MCDKELLVAYLYDELGGADRARMDVHLGACPACREDLAGLRGVRADLKTWAPPEPDLGFRMVHERAAPPSRGWRAWFTPALGLAAAATLVLAAAAGVANVQVHYGSDGLTVRTGWARPAPADAPSALVKQTAAASIDPATMQVIERRIADLEQFEKTAQASSGQPAAVQASASRVSDAELLKRFRTLLSQSENRQDTLLARQIQQVSFEFDRKRTDDMARVTQMGNDIYYKLASDAVQHRQIVDALRASNQK